MSASVNDLLKGHFQVAYITTDLDRATTELGRVLGFRQTVPLPDEVPVSGRGGDGVLVGRALLASVGGPTVIELIEPSRDVGDLFSSMLGTGSGYRTRLHHLGVRVPDIDALRDALRDEGRDFELFADLGAVRAGFLDLRNEVGHWIEALEMSEEMWASVNELRQ